MIFEIKSDLPIETQRKIDAIELIPSAQRTANQTAFLTSLTPYLTNLIISMGTDGLITTASGLTVPTGYAGFRKGATFIKTDAATNGQYMNTGSTTSATWDLVDEASTSNIVDGAVTIPKLGTNVVLNSGYDYYVDVNRTDTYTENGSILTPYKTLLACWTAIKAHALALTDKQKGNYTVHLAAGTYADNITLTTVKYIKFVGAGVVLSGTWLLDQTPIGGSGGESYTRVEFEGMNGWRAEKGYAMTISGNMTLERSNDSLTYLCFRGVYVTGNILGDTKGTWVVQSNGSYINGSITMTPTDATSCMLLETSGWARFNGTINGTITLSKVESAEFSKAITITPITAGGDLKVINTTFAVSASIIGTRTLSIDANSYKSLSALTPTLTGMTIVYIDEPVNSADKYTFYVDGGRTDNYTATGTIQCPYKTVVAAVNAIKTLYTAAADKQTTCYTINITAGTYSDAFELTTIKNVRFIGSGVVLSGAITLTQSPIGGSGQEPYTRIEFIGTSGIRAEKGKGMTISGNITATRTNDSLTYINFKGCWISGNQLYDGDGTWVTQYENCRVAGTIDTGTFATPDSQVLIECTGWNEFAGAITDGVSFYNVDNADFWGTITTTPYFESVFTNTRFHAAVSIVAATNLYMDSYSMKSMFAQTHTLTGQVIIPLDSQAEIVYNLSSADILAMNPTPVTIVPAVTGKTIVVDDICLKMTTTATGYANGGAVEFRYTNASGAKVTADIAAAVITAGAGTSYTINKSIVTSLTGVISSPIVITNADAAFITGTGTGVLTIRYHLI